MVHNFLKSPFNQNFFHFWTIPLNLSWVSHVKVYDKTTFTVHENSGSLVCRKPLKILKAEFISPLLAIKIVSNRLRLYYLLCLIAINTWGVVSNIDCYAKRYSSKPFMYRRHMAIEELSHCYLKITCKFLCFMLTLVIRNRIRSNVLKVERRGYNKLGSCKLWFYTGKYPHRYHSVQVNRPLFNVSRHFDHISCIDFDCLLKKWEFNSSSPSQPLHP